MAPLSARASHAAGSPVVLLRWPRDAVRRDELAARGLPCLLLIEGDAPPPHVRELEDWMRVPGDERDLLRRVERLELHYCGPPRSAPLLDQGVLRVSDSTVVLSPAETSLVSRLLADFERVVPRAELERSVWGQLTRSPRALDSLVSRCRRSIEATGLTIAAVRGRGFTLAVVDDDDG